MATGSSTFTACNRLLQKKWDDKKLKEHKERLRKIQPSVDNGFPREYAHIRQNKRKQKIEEDRQATIHRHNNELLTRMHHIMHTTGRVDHRSDWKPKRSLNYMKRQNDTDRIARENQSLLRRLQTVRPQYNSKEWEVDYRQHQSRSKNMQLFPHIEETKTSPERHKLRLNSDIPVLPPIVSDHKTSSRPETQPMSEIREEIDVDD